jgi:hypothetical protein
MLIRNNWKYLIQKTIVGYNNKETSKYFMKLIVAKLQKKQTYFKKTNKHQKN